jgi:hypothetical protein
MTTLLDAARQALPGLEWSDVGSDGVPYVYGKGNGCEYGVFDLDDVAEVRADAMSRRDALDAALGESDRGTNAEKLKTLAGLVEKWGVFPHWADCPAFVSKGKCDCGADAANAARVEARKILEVKS